MAAEADQIQDGNQNDENHEIGARIGIRWQQVNQEELRVQNLPIERGILRNRAILMGQNQFHNLGVTIEERRQALHQQILSCNAFLVFITNNEEPITSLIIFVQRNTVVTQNLLLERIEEFRITRNMIENVLRMNGITPRERRELIGEERIQFLLANVAIWNGKPDFKMQNFIII